MLANFNQGMAACSGEIIIAMAGDDVAMPQRVSRIAAEFAANPRCMLVYSDWQRIDDAGNPLTGSCGHREDKTFAYGPRPDCVYAGGKGRAALLPTGRISTAFSDPLISPGGPRTAPVGCARSCWGKSGIWRSLL